MKTYFTKTNYNSYKFERRIPKPLLNYVEGRSFRITLGTDSTEATKKAIEYNKSIEEALQYIKMGLPSEMILNTLDCLIQKERVNLKI